MKHSASGREKAVQGERDGMRESEREERESGAGRTRWKRRQQRCAQER